MEQEHVTAWIAALVGGGGLVGWYRERRKTRKDANTFALQLIETQNARIDNLTFQVGELNGRVAQLTDTNIALTTENLRLKSELAALSRPPASSR